MGLDDEADATDAVIWSMWRDAMARDPDKSFVWAPGEAWSVKTQLDWPKTRLVGCRMHVEELRRILWLLFTAQADTLACIFMAESALTKKSLDAMRAQKWSRLSQWVNAVERFVAERHAKPAARATEHVRRGER